MRNIFIAVLICLSFYKLKAQNLFVADTFTNTINLDLSQNLYLKSVPVDLLKGYCNGDWNAYYPKKEMNQCLFDDFLQRFNYYQINVPKENSFCFDDYCNQACFIDMYKQFSRKLKYKEVLYFNQQHSIVKREVLWVQVYYSIEENGIWFHFDGPIFWMLEINKSNKTVMVSNKNMISNSTWTLAKEFSTPKFIVNENQQKDAKKKMQKILQTEEY